MIEKKLIIKLLLFILFLLFIAVSFFIGLFPDSEPFIPGIEIGKNFGLFSFEMVKILPAIFILIGLFDVWIKKETIEKHLGVGGGIKSFLWVFILAAPMAGGLLPAFPIAQALLKKGARLTVIFVF